LPDKKSKMGIEYVKKEKLKINSAKIMPEKNLILLRGLPGSGKSSLAKILCEDGRYPSFSVDDFFTNKETGDYHFEFEKNHLAYKACEENTRAAMKNSTKKIFIHNTFTMEWELEPYFKMAGEFNYSVFVVTVEKRHSGKNEHGVTEEQLKKMAEKFKVVLF
jgi:predicted kinase